MDSNKQKNWTIVGIIALFIILVVIWLFSNVFVNKDATYTLKVSPMDATVTLDGKQIKAGKITVSKGTHELSGTRKDFTKATRQISTDNDLPDSTIYLVLGADSIAAKQYIADHEEEQVLREGASDTEITKLNDKLIANYPYISKLPYQTLDFVVEYQTKEDATIALIVTLNPVTNPADTTSYKEELVEYKEHSVDYMKSIGVDMQKTEIKYEPDPARL